MLKEPKYCTDCGGVLVESPPTLNSNFDPEEDASKAAAYHVECQTCGYTFIVVGYEGGA